MELTEKEKKTIKDEEKKSYIEEKKKIAKSKGKARAREESQGPVWVRWIKGLIKWIMGE